MELIDFYKVLLPAGGRYVLFQNKSHSFFDSLDALTKATQKRIDSQGLYFATAAYGGIDNRTGDNVIALRAHRVDIDAGVDKFAKHPEGAYETQQGALQALIASIKAGLPPPTLIVSSGEGLHAYWALNDDVAPGVWKPAAMMLNAAGKALGLKIDSGCTADLARVLRPVGTLHKNGSRVMVLKNTKITYDHKTLLDKLTALAPNEDSFEILVARVPKGASVNDDILDVKGPPASLARVAEHCAAVAEMRDKHGNIPEPHWRAVMGIAKYCDDGEQVVHEWSQGYHGYDPHETQEKLERWETPPTKCAFFDTLTDACKTCKYRGKITTPKQVGYIAVVQAAAEPAPIADAAPDAAYTLAMADEPEVESTATADAPVADRPDLFDESLPFFYREKDKRWVLYHRTKVTTADATGQKVTTELIKPVCHKLIWVDSSSLPGASDTDGVLVQFGRIQKAGSTRQDRFDMPAGVGAANDTLAKFLADQGINLDPSNIDAAKHMRHYVQREIIRKQNDMRFVIKDRFGYHFHEGQFICSMGPYTVYPDGSIVKTIYNTTLAGVAQALTVNCLPPQPNQKWGSEAWPEVAKATANYIRFVRASYGHNGYEVARLALAISLASPLLVFAADAPFNDAAELPAVGFVVSMYSTSSGIGKSSLQEVVAAAYGKPELKRSGKKAAMTDIAAYTLAKVTGIYPFILDEVTQNDAGQAAALIDTFANGAGKIRARNDGVVAKSAATWALVTLLSTNVPQRELIAQKQKNSDALQMRLLELNFDGLMPVGDQEAFGKGLKEASIKCGAFGLTLARLVVSAGPAAITDMVQANLKRAYTLLGVEQQFRFFARGMAAMLTMNQLLGRSAPFDEEELIATFRKAVAATAWFVESNKTSPAAEVAQMLNDMSPNIIVTKSFSISGDTVDPVLNPGYRLPLAGREVQEWRSVLIDSRAVHKWCADSQMSAKAFLDGAEKAGVLVMQPDGSAKSQRRLTTGIPGMPGQKGWYYNFRTRGTQAAVVDSGNVVELRQPEKVEQPEVETATA